MMLLLFSINATINSFFPSNLRQKICIAVVLYFFSTILIGSSLLLFVVLSFFLLFFWCFVEVKGTEFEYIEKHAQEHDASADCVSRGGYLAIIDSQEKFDQVYNLLTNNGRFVYA